MMDQLWDTVEAVSIQTVHILLTHMEKHLHKWADVQTHRKERRKPSWHNDKNIQWQNSFLNDCLNRLWKCFVLFSRFTYIHVLNEKMLAGSIPKHREHITLLLVTLPHQEVSIILQQLLDFKSGDGSVVPVLLPQRTIHLLHSVKARKHLKAGREEKQNL